MQATVAHAAPRSSRHWQLEVQEMFPLPLYLKERALDQGRGHLRVMTFSVVLVRALHHEVVVSDVALKRHRRK